MSLRSNQPNHIAPEIVRVAITDVLKQNYLGSSNKKTNETGDLNGYYLCLARNIHAKQSKDGVLPAEMAILFSAGALFYTGAGNCGELVSALYVHLFKRPDLSRAQKESIESCEYPSNDAHLSNSYLKIGSQVYDIWDNRKECDIGRYYKKSLVNKKKHISYQSFNKYADKTPEQISAMIKLFMTNFGKKFEEAIKEDRRTNRLYPTLDTNDKSEYAIFSLPAIVYLYRKFVETFNDEYFIARNEIATIVRGKILKDLVYLLEELRQDYPIDQQYIKNHPGRTRLTDTETKNLLTTNITDTLFVDFITLMSYRNFRMDQLRDGLKRFQFPEGEQKPGSTHAFICDEIKSLQRVHDFKANASVSTLIESGQHPFLQKQPDFSVSTLDETVQKSRVPSTPLI